LVERHAVADYGEVATPAVFSSFVFATPTLMMCTSSTNAMSLFGGRATEDQVLDRRRRRGSPLVL
jgi:hypothetical protein